MVIAESSSKGRDKNAGARIAIAAVLGAKVIAAPGKLALHVEHYAHDGLAEAFDHQVSSTKRGVRYADCRIRTGFAFDSHFCYATGDREWSSEKSRFIVAAIITMLFRRFRWL